MDKYFNADVNRALCAEYAELVKKPLCPNVPEDQKRKEEIRQHIAFEVISAYCNDHGPEDKE